MKRRSGLSGAVEMKSLRNKLQRRSDGRRDSVDQSGHALFVVAEEVKRLVLVYVVGFLDDLVPAAGLWRAERQS